METPPTVLSLILYHTCRPAKHKRRAPLNVISVVFASLIAQHGLEYLFAIVVLMGLIQISIGVLNLVKYARIIPYSVMLGFLNGLSIVMFLAQWAQFKVDEVVANGVEMVTKMWLLPVALGIMIFFVIVTMAIIHFVPKYTNAIPSSLVAIIVMIIIAVLLGKMVIL
ncbi:SulP family inorganic anion transporter [Anoxynatronum buryatiense]|uniref:SulP family inorganic anion transporter n=1 Tax=Anoxynatronum buryatiense TaxID=489973 RepID=UPI0024B83BE9|nr:SulP family inorganic anion transporter [Anoxynatronum buryatiense]